MNSIAGLEVAVGDWASVDAFRGRRSNTICSSPVPTETTAFGVTSVVSLASLQVLGGKHEQHIDGAAIGLVINGHGDTGFDWRVAFLWLTEVVRK